MNWDEIQNHWPELKRAIRAEHPDLDTDRLEQTAEGRRQLLQLIDAKYGAAKPKADEDLDHIVSDQTAKED